MSIGAHMQEDSESGKHYDASEADAVIAKLEQDNARWISARDVWAAEMKAKDERIKELEMELTDAIESIDCWIESYATLQVAADSVK